MDFMPLNFIWISKVIMDCSQIIPPVDAVHVLSQAQTDVTRDYSTTRKQLHYANMQLIWQHIGALPHLSLSDGILVSAFSGMDCPSRHNIMVNQIVWPDTMLFFTIGYPEGWSACSETTGSGSVAIDQVVICENQYTSWVMFCHL